MAVSDTLIGTVFDGRYLIVRKLGAGGMKGLMRGMKGMMGGRGGMPFR